jgi:hypothetical protein
MMMKMMKLGLAGCAARLPGLAENEPTKQINPSSSGKGRVNILANNLICILFSLSAPRSRQRVRPSRPIVPARGQFVYLVRMARRQVVEFGAISRDVVKLSFPASRADQFPVAGAHSARSVVLKKERGFS